MAVQQVIDTVVKCLLHETRVVPVGERDAASVDPDHAHGMVDLETDADRVLRQHVDVTVTIAEHDTRGVTNQFIDDVVTTDVTEVQQNLAAVRDQRRDRTSGRLGIAMRIRQDTDEHKISFAIVQTRRMNSAGRTRASVGPQGRTERSN